MANKGSSIRARLRAAKLELLDLKIEVQSIIEKTEKELDSVWMDIGKRVVDKFELSAVRQLRGHYGKVCDISWCSDPAKSHLLASVGQDAKLLLWDAQLQRRVAAVSLPYAWVMSGAASSDAQLICAGGLDNAVSIYRLADTDGISLGGIITEPSCQLKGHDGYVSDCKFLTSTSMLTASGDSTCALWDTDACKATRIFCGHDADVQALGLNPVDSNIFASGSCDSLIRIMDVRDSSKTAAVIRGHEGDVNDVCFSECGNLVCSASNDSTCRMNDVRIQGPLSVFSNSSLSGVACNSVALSKSNSVIFTGHEDATLIAWQATSAHLYVLLLTQRLTQHTGLLFAEISLLCPSKSIKQRRQRMAAIPAVFQVCA